MRRALLSPMAIACLRFLIRCFPERLWCISVRTSRWAFRLYLRPLEREVERCDRERPRLEELRLCAIVTSPYQTPASGRGLARTTGCRFRIKHAGRESKQTSCKVSPVSGFRPQRLLSFSEQRIRWAR